MVPRMIDPNTNKPIHLHSFKEFERAARKAAGLPEYRLDDPERPFTPEYENPVVTELEPEDASADVVVPEEAPMETEDTTPSADNRAMYRQPTPADLHAERVKQVRERYLDPVRALLKAAEEKRNAEAQKRGY